MEVWIGQMPLRPREGERVELRFTLKESEDMVRAVVDLMKMGFSPDSEMIWVVDGKPVPDQS
jgi:hypothetical protein